MNTLEVFNPLVKIAQDLKDKYSKLEIQGIDDKLGYVTVDTARKQLKEARVLITKTGKDLRDDANKFAKDVIAKEKELVGLIEPLEIELQNKVNLIDNQAKLPERLVMLAEINIKGNPDEINLMKDPEFNKYFNAENAKYLQAKEQELKQREAELARAREIELAEARAKEQAENEAKLVQERLEAEKNTEIERLKLEAEQREQKIKQTELARIEAEKLAEANRLAEIEKEKNDKELQNWLKENNVTSNDIVKNDNGIYKIYRLVAERKF